MKYNALTLRMLKYNEMYRGRYSKLNGKRLLCKITKKSRGYKNLKEKKR